MRPTLTYKVERAGIQVGTVDRFFPSSRFHHGCGGRLIGARLAKRLTCKQCFSEVDRDENAATNIRDRLDTNPGPVEASVLFVPGPFGTDDSSDDGLTHHPQRADQSGAYALATLGEERTDLSRLTHYA
ncbi:MAG: transposase [Acidimicrobiaceae bacterium]|nr:transposase [Acidimicrobiaceae bacterium]